MRKEDKLRATKRLDQEAIYKPRTKEDIDRYKDLDVHDIFMVMTSQGADVFLPMIENSISRIFEEKLKEVATGIMAGLVDENAGGWVPGGGDTDDDEDFGPVQEEGGYVEHPAEAQFGVTKPKIHQSSWKPEEDEALMYIITTRDGTLQRAYEVAGEKLGRTPSACGFRYQNHLKDKL